MNKHLTPILWISVLGLGAMGLTEHQPLAVKAETGDTHHLAFGEVDHAVLYNPNGAAQSASSLKASSDGTTLTLTTTNTGSYYSNEISLEAGVTYLFTGEVMMPETGGGLNIALNKVWGPTTTSLYSESVTPNVYNTFSVTYTPTAASTDQIILQVTKTPSQGVFKFRHLFLAKEYDVTEGSAIGSIVPSLPANTADKRYDYWTIDGTQINASTVYSYTEDKLALPHYSQLHSLTFQYPDDVTNPNLFYDDGAFNTLDGWNVSSASDLISIQSDVAVEGSALKYNKTNADGTSYFQSQGYTLFSNSTYRLSFSIKVENASGLDFSTFIAGEEGYLSWKDYFTASVTANCDWTTVSAEFQVNAGTNLETSGFFVGFKFYAGAGTVYLDNAKLELVKNVRYYADGDLLGALPTLPTKAGYHGSSWLVDGEAINASTAWKWGENKTPTVEYAANEYTLSFAYFDYGSNTTGASVSDPKLTYSTDTDGLMLTNTLEATASYQTPTFRLPAGSQYRLIGNVTLKEGSSASITLKGTETPLTASSFAVDFSLAEATDFSFTVNLSAKGEASFASFYLLDLSKNMTVTYQSKIGTLPTFETVPEGKLVTWRLNGTKLSENSVYETIGNSIAILSFESESHNLSFQIGDSIVETREVAYGDPIGTFPTYEAREGYEAKWMINGVEATSESLFNYHEDTVAVLTFTPITYHATFEADGEVVAVVPFTVEDTTLEEPEIPAKKGYSAHWESYELQASDITIHAVYEANHYFVTIKASQYGEVLSYTQITYGQKLGDVITSWPTLPAKDGYAFDHWECDGQEVTLDTVFEYEDNIEIYAVYHAVTPEPSSEDSTDITPSSSDRQEPTNNGSNPGVAIGVGVGVGVAVIGIGVGVYFLVRHHKHKKTK